MELGVRCGDQAFVSASDMLRRSPLRLVHPGVDRPSAGHAAAECDDRQTLAPMHLAITCTRLGLPGSLNSDARIPVRCLSRRLGTDAAPGLPISLVQV